MTPSCAATTVTVTSTRRLPGNTSFLLAPRPALPVGLTDWGPRVDGILQILSVSNWLISLTMVSSGFIRVVACQGSLPSLEAEGVPLSAWSAFWVSSLQSTATWVAPSPGHREYCCHAHSCGPRSSQDPRGLPRKVGHSGFYSQESPGASREDDYSLRDGSRPLS